MQGTHSETETTTQTEAEAEAETAPEAGPAGDVEPAGDPGSDVASGPETGAASGDADREEAMPGARECHETVDPGTREDVLAEYGHRCQSCGRCGPGAGGLATLHVHHIERDPDGMGVHDRENLTLLCRACHAWLHRQSTPEDAPVELTEADQTLLLPQDIEVLQYLATHGPARTGDIAAGVATDLSVSAVRQRLWVLMGLDNRVESREEQLVDKDVETGEWGLSEQIEQSARGHIPDDKQVLLQRMEDEQVRRALERGCDRGAVTDVLGITRRTTFNKIKRAYAYDFPLDAFSRGGRPAGDAASGQASVSEEMEDDDETDAAQQHLDAVGDDEEEPGRGETWAASDAEREAPRTLRDVLDGEAPGGDRVGDEAAVRERVRTAIEALEDVTDAL